MAGYERTYNKSSGETINASDFNTEYAAIDTAFDESSGHTHDGSAGEGQPVGKIGDSSFYNKINVDSGNNELEFCINVSSASVEQFIVKDGVIEPTTDNDIDLGSASKEFKDLYIDGTANIDTASIDALTINTSISLPDDAIQVGDIGAGALPADVTVNNGNWSGTDLAVANGGTGASDAATALSNLGLTVTAAELNHLDGLTAFIDDDTMATASATSVASSESIKAYVDASSGGSWTRKTGAYTAVDGDQLLCDPGGGAFTIALPASPTGGMNIKVKTEASTSPTYTVTLNPQGSNVIAGQSGGTTLVIDLPHVELNLVYDTTDGWYI
jgi:hypothetical protein